MSFSVFGGSGDVDKKTKIINTTNTTTTTNTSMGDVGLTGDAAVALAGTFANQNVSTTQLQSQSLRDLAVTHESGLSKLTSSFDALVGEGLGGISTGIKDLGGLAMGALGEVGARSERSAANLLLAAKDVASPAAAAQETVRQQTKSLTVVIVAIAAIAGLAFLAKRGK